MLGIFVLTSHGTTGISIKNTTAWGCIFKPSCLARCSWR